MPVQEKPLDCEESRCVVFAKWIKNVEEMRQRIEVTVRDTDKRSLGLRCCIQLIHRYRLGVSDWSEESQALLSAAEAAYMEMQDIVFSE